MSSLRRLRHTIVLWAIGVVVAACSSPQEKIEQSARTARSWSATARTASAALDRGAVPRVYARQVLREAIEGKRQLSREPAWLSLPRHTRDQLDRAIRELASSLADSLSP